MRYDVHGLCCCEEGDDGPVAVEAEVAVVRHDVDRGVPGDGVRHRRGPRTGVVDRADVDTSESNAWKRLEDLVPGAQWLGWVQEC